MSISSNTLFTLLSVTHRLPLRPLHVPTHRAYDVVVQLSLTSTSGLSYHLRPSLRPPPLPFRCRYADRLLPDVSAKNRPSMVDFGHRRSIEGEIDHRRLIKGEKGKKKKRKRRKKEKRSTYFPAPFSSVRRRRPRVASARAPLPSTGHGLFFSRASRRNVSPCGEKGRGDIAPFFY
ncbi:hypothetical protein GW17_00060924 [Ensete ventricosum]|nr:hypothetical protein GW17_00060924 [Ensete ventricosum]